MQPTIANTVIELAFGIFALGAAGFLLRHYMTLHDTDGKPIGISLRAIRLIVAVLVAPIILILALEDAITKEAVGIILGVLVGFILSLKD
jgi:hypothetical protein